MNKESIQQLAAQIFSVCPGNQIIEENAVNADVIGISLYDVPLVGIGSAQDALWEKYREEGIIGPWFMTPEDWMPEAKTVISMFFPFTEEVKASNRCCTDGPSSEWLHGRIEGQAYLGNFAKEMCAFLENKGIRCCVPFQDSRFRKIIAGKGMPEYSDVSKQTFGSNWSERHAAYVCGLGTFGLSKGLITERGMAGRFLSFIIDTEIGPDPRPYTGVYDYCTKCVAE